MKVHLVALLSAAPLAAQTTWTVPSGVTDLTPFLAQAAPGDILLLGANPHYNGFVLDKGVTLVGPATVGLGGGFPGPMFNSNTLQVVLPPGQRANLVGITMSGSYMSGYFTIAARLQVQGAVSLDGVTIGGGSITLAGDALMQRCTVNALLETGLPALTMTSGTCVATDCSFQGTNGVTTYSGGPAGCSAGIHQTGGTFHGSHVFVRGGNCHPWTNSNDTAAYRAAGGTGYLTDSTLQGGNGSQSPVPNPGGHAIEVAGGNVSIARTSLTDGAFASGPSAGYQTTPQMVGMSTSGPLIRGSSFTATATAGSSQELFGIVGGFDATLATVPPIVEPLCGIPAQLICLLVAFPTPGAAVPQVVVVPNVAALLGSQVWLQAVQLDGSSIHASTAAGGVIR